MLKFLVLLAAFSSAHADDAVRNNGQSKENKDMESEGTFDLPKLPNFWKFIKKISPKDGRVRVTMNSSGGFTEDAKNAKTYDLALETIVFGTVQPKVCPYGHKTYYGGECDIDKVLGDTKYAIMPVSFHFSIDKRSLDLNTIEFKDFRASAVRIMETNLGITADVASYVMKKYPGNIGTFKGGEITNFTVKGAAKIPGTGNFELVLKGELAFAVGKTVSGDSREQIQQAADASGYVASVTKYDPYTIHVPVRGSAGVRAWGFLLVDVYGGFEKNWIWSNKYDEDYSDFDNTGFKQVVKASSDLRHTYLGVGLRGQVRGVVVSGNFEKEGFKQDFEFVRNYSESLYHPEDGTRSTTFKENQASAHNRKDSGYNAMISIGYDW